MKAQKTRRIIGTMLAGAMVMASMAACSNGDAKTSSTTGTSSSGASSTTQQPADGKLTNEVVTYSFLRPENALQPYTEGCETVTEIEKRTGIKLDVMIVPAADWSTKMNTLMAADQMPDFFRLWTSATEVASSGTLLELDQYINDQTPIIKNLYETIPNLDKTTIGGKNYTLPTIRMDTNYQVGACPSIRVDLLKENNLEIPKTWDELYNVLKVFKEKYPDSVVYGARGDGVFRTSVGPLKSLGADYNLYQDETGVWKLGRMQENYKSALEFINKLYKDGILDSEYLITSAQDWKSGLGNGKYLFYYDNPQFINAFNTSLQAVKEGARFEPIPVLANSKGERTQYGYASHTFNEYGFNSSIKDPQLALRFFDWLYSEEGALLMNYGIEGQDWEMVNDEPHFKADVVKSYQDKSADPYYAAASEKGLGSLFFAPGWYSHSNYDFSVKASEDAVDDVFIYNVYKDEMNTIIDAPVEPPYTDAEAEQITKIKQNIEDYSATEINKFISGERSISEFDQFVEHLKKNGAEEWEKIANEAQARYEASK